MGKMRKGETFFVPIDDCVPNPWNPNEMDDAEFNRLVREIEENGMLNPIHLVPLSEGKHHIIGGEHRWRACKLLGYKEIEAKLLTAEKFRKKDLQKFITLRQQCIQGKLNPKKFVALYEEMVDRYNDEALQELMGVTDSDKWMELTGGVTDALSAAGVPASLVSDFEQKVKKVKDVDDLGMILDSLFEKHGHDLKYNFMVFTFAGKDHYYIQMNKLMFRRMNDMAVFCRDNNLDINQVFLQLLEMFHSRSKYGIFLKQCKIGMDDVKK